MAKLHRTAVYTLDRIIRNTRDAIEEQAKECAAERGEEEATADDIMTAATVVFESDHQHLLRRQ